jgi:[acyl-carrier-protein] S-malonyltransferase
MSHNSQNIAFLFPGQASQYVGMGHDFYNNIPTVREMYRKADKVLNLPISKISFSGPMETLTETKITQPAIFVHSVIIATLLTNNGYNPAVVAGHSLGEYSALVAIGGISFSEGLILVKMRGEGMQKASQKNPGTMAAIIGLSVDKIQQVCAEVSAIGTVQPANFNSPGQIAISGEVDAVRSAMEKAKQKGARRAIELNVSGAFHSPLMHPATLTLERILGKFSIKKPRFPIYSNVDAKPTKDQKKIKENLIQQVEKPVLWQQTIENMIKDGIATFIEIGPGNVLQGLVKRISKEVKVEGISTVEDYERFIHDYRSQ